MEKKLQGPLRILQWRYYSLYLFCSLVFKIEMQTQKLHQSYNNHMKDFNFKMQDPKRRRLYHFCFVDTSESTFDEQCEFLLQCILILG